MYVTPFVIFLQFFEMMFCPFHPFFPLHFSLGNFYSHFFKAIWVSLCTYTESIEKLIKAFFISVSWFLTFLFLFLGFPSPYITCVPSCYPPFLLELLTYHSFKFQVWSFQHYCHIWHWVWYLLHFFKLCFFCLLICFIIFYWELYVMYRVEGFWLNRPFMWRFVYLASVGLCLLFLVTVGIKG